MLSNTENNSASDNVNTRPRLKAYFNFIGDFLKNNQKNIALACGYVLVAALFFGLGKFSTSTTFYHPVSIEEPALDLTQINNNLKTAAGQSPGAVAGAAQASDCEGKIKGNISSSGKIYHVPGGASYKTVQPEMCFETEKQAQDAGFRKAKR